VEIGFQTLQAADLLGLVEPDFDFRLGFHRVPNPILIVFGVLEPDFEIYPNGKKI
jgi:hypothetical protein